MSRRVSDNLERLIAANAPLWAGEAEVFRVYWDSPSRTRGTDLRWISRQCYKEFYGYRALSDRLPAQCDAMERGGDRREALAAARGLYQELTHYCVFADLHDALRAEGDPVLAPEDWPENVALCRVRADHKARYGPVGLRAHAFTEGGYCTLLSEGMKLEGRGGTESAIAQACGKVYDDEFEHMLHGIAGLDRQPLTEAEWGLVTDLTVEQMKLRIHMRNAQFGHPVPDTRIRELCAGKAAPLAFDYARAGLM